MEKLKLLLQLFAEDESEEPTEEVENPSEDEDDEEGELLKFVTTSDIFLFDKNVIPKGTKLLGYIEKKNEPIVGTNASMKVFINKI